MNLDSQMNKIFEITVHELIVFMKNMNFEIIDRKERIDELSKNMKDSMKEIKEKILKEN